MHPETLFGPNWRTTLSGLSATAAAITVALFALPTDIWKEPKVWVPAVLFAIARTIQDVNTKDARVSGNGTLSAPTQIDRGDGTSRQLPSK
jgi:hypothetical protein